MYDLSTSEKRFLFIHPPHRDQPNCIQIPYKTPKKPSFCYFSLQIPFFAVIQRFCSWLSSVTQSHHALEHENTYISLTLLPRVSYRARRGTSPCLAAGLNNHRTEAGFHCQSEREREREERESVSSGGWRRLGRAYVNDVAL
jgi:hypothetical protein